MYRQGDVLIIEVAHLPTKLKRIESEQGLVILARGEATGHNHTIAVSEARPEVELYETSEAIDRWLRVGDQGCVLTHPEHGPVPLPEGIYRVVRQREYTPQQIRRVAD